MEKFGKTKVGISGLVDIWERQTDGSVKVFLTCKPGKADGVIEILNEIGRAEYIHQIPERAEFSQV
jgi:hypothetical protein